MSNANLQNIAHLGRPLTEEEKAYLHNRSRDWEIAENERQFPGTHTPSSKIPLYSEVGAKLQGEQMPAVEQADEDTSKHDFSKFDPNLVKEVQTLNVPDLKSELKERKVDVPSNANKAHLQFLLVQAVSAAQEK